MKPNEGRLQTGEHILAKIVEDKVSDAKFVMAKFDKENEGSVEFLTKTDLREIGIEEIEGEVNEIIRKELVVNKTVKKREDVSESDLGKIPDSVKEVRIVEIEGFDKRPCKDPHVGNTKEIGYFKVVKIKRVGKDRYRFKFNVE